METGLYQQGEEVARGVPEPGEVFGADLDEYTVGTFQDSRRPLEHELLVAFDVQLQKLNPRGRQIQVVEANDRDPEGGLPIYHAVRWNPAMTSITHVEVGSFLAGVSSPGDVVVANEICAIGHSSRVRLVDYRGARRACRTSHSTARHADADLTT